MPQDGAPSTPDWQLVDADVESIQPNPGSNWVTVMKTSGEAWGEFWTANFWWTRLNFGRSVARVFFSSQGLDTESAAYVAKTDGSLWRATWVMPLTSRLSLPTYEAVVATNVRSVVYDPYVLMYVDGSGTLVHQMIDSGVKTTLATGVTDLQGVSIFGYGYLTSAGSLYKSAGAAGSQLVANHVARFSYGANGIVYQTNNGAVWGVGANTSGQLGANGTTEATNGPVLMATAADSFAAGATSTLIATTGRRLASTLGSGRLVNVSTRNQVLAGRTALTAGLVIKGTGTRTLLVRVVGPTLAPFGVSGVVPNPRLDVFSAGAVCFSNDDWSAQAQPDRVVQTGTRVGAFPLPAGSSDAALVGTFSPGSYSVQAAAAGATTGIGLIEVYDAETTGTSRIVNMSSLGQSGTGDSVLVQGVAIAGSARRVLIRGVSRSLAAYGINNGLSDPVLTIYDNDRSVVATNDNWSAGANVTDVAAAAAAAGAFPFTDDRDAAILITLPPGGYTATVADAKGGTGIAMVEVYEVPDP